MSNTVFIVIDDNAVIQKNNRREYKDLGLTVYCLKYMQNHNYKQIINPCVRKQISEGIYL